MRRTRAIPTIAALAAAFITRAAHACPVCFGESDTAPAHGIRAAITFMLGVTAFVLVAMAFVVFRIRARSKRGAA